MPAPTRVNAPLVDLHVRPHPDDALAPARRNGGPRPREGVPMADLAYALLLITGFALLVLMVRGLDAL